MHSIEGWKCRQYGYSSQKSATRPSDGESVPFWVITISSTVSIAVAAAWITDAKQLQYFSINRKTVFGWWRIWKRDTDRQMDGQTSGVMRQNKVKGTAELGCVKELQWDPTPTDWGEIKIKSKLRVRAMCVCVCVWRLSIGLFGLAAATQYSMATKQDGKADLATTQAECAVAGAPCPAAEWP